MRGFFFCRDAGEDAGVKIPGAEGSNSKIPAPGANNFLMMRCNFLATFLQMLDKDAGKC